MKRKGRKMFSIDKHSIVHESRMLLVCALIRWDGFLACAAQRSINDWSFYAFEWFNYYYIFWIEPKYHITLCVYTCKRIYITRNPIIIIIIRTTRNGFVWKIITIRKFALFTTVHGVANKSRAQRLYPRPLQTLLFVHRIRLNEEI